ncbi:MAG TPA: TonB-dependent receptor, partial [Nitrosomonas europaea]|nr:TonB-dependent receptor [Nitrosomonas europaea]
ALQRISVLTGEARNEGIELDITGELLPGWQVIANYAYINSEVTKTNDNTLGNRFPNVPEHAGNIWTTYAFQNETLRGLKVGGGVTLRGKREGNLENDYQMPGYAVFNLMTSYGMKVGKTRVTAQLNVNNLFNEEYFPSSGGFGRTRIAVGTPRVFLGSLRVEY